MKSRVKLNGILIRISNSLTYNSSNSLRGGFLAPIFLIVTDWLGDIGLLVVPPPGVYIISYSIMNLYFCWSLHFPADLYIFLMFYLHLCSHISLLFNDWSTPMVTLCCFNRYYCNKPLLKKHWCSNDSISITKSITLVYACDSAHSAEWSLLPSIWKLRYYFTGEGIFWLGLWVVLLSWYCSDSDPNKTWALGSVTLLLFCGGVSNNWESSLTNIF